MNEIKIKNKINHFTVLLRHPHYSKKKTILERFFPVLYADRLQSRKYVEGYIDALNDVLEDNDFAEEKEEQTIEYWEKKLAPYRH